MGYFGAWDMSGFCGKTADIIGVVGWVLTIFKIAIPLIIIVLGAFDLGQAVVSGKDDDIKKKAKSLGYRALAGFIIFLLPSIVLWVFGLINDFNDMTEQIGWTTCKTCILEPWKCPDSES